MIRVLQNNIGTTFKELLGLLQDSTPPFSMPISQDALLHYWDNIIEKIDYDSQAEGDESVFLGSPSLQTLVELTGIKVNRGQIVHTPQTKKLKAQTKATVTPLVASVCNSIFEG